MNSKAIRKQLFAAVAMVLVAAVALGSSTYAWFAANNRVTAEGMTVTAQAEGGIEIKAVAASNGALASGATTTWQTTASAAIADGVALYPTSTLANTAANSVLTSPWYYAKAAVATANTAKPDTFVKLANDSSADANWTFGYTSNAVTVGDGVLGYKEAYAGEKAANTGRYYLATTFNIASVSSGSATDLFVTGVTIGGASTGTDEAGAKNKALDKSLRVAIVCGDKSVVYAPYGYDTTGKASYIVATETAGTPGQASTATKPESANMEPLCSSEASDVIAANVGSETSPSVVNVYIWYEGEDTNHYTNNLTTSVDDLSVTVNFQATLA